jgi:hypothetical protein
VRYRVNSNKTEWSAKNTQDYKIGLTLIRELNIEGRRVFVKRETSSRQLRLDLRKRAGYTAGLDGHAKLADDLRG